MAENIFQKIIAKEIPANIIHEDDECLAFHDVAPQAPTHVLVIPNRHVVSMEDAADDPELVARVMVAARAVARQEGLSDGGYRLVTNVGDDGGQTVSHLHVHVLGGRRLSWPPG